MLAEVVVEVGGGLSEPPKYTRATSGDARVRQSHPNPAKPVGLVGGPELTGR